jgi:hypothetical protein
MVENLRRGLGRSAARPTFVMTRHGHFIGAGDALRPKLFTEMYCDAERIITGSDGSAWYTTDHYHTFHRIR